MKIKIARICMLVIILAAVVLALAGTVHAAPLYQEETATPTETPTPTITPIYVYERVITAGDTFSINAQVVIGLIQIALLLAIIVLLVFRRRGG